MNERRPILRAVETSRPGDMVTLSAFLGLKAELKTARKSLTAEKSKSDMLAGLVEKLSIAVAVLSSMQPNGTENSPIGVICAATGLTPLTFQAMLTDINSMAPKRVER